MRMSFFDGKMPKETALEFYIGKRMKFKDL